MYDVEAPPSQIKNNSVVCATARGRMKMFVLLATLLFLRQACSLVPVMRVQLGEPATFPCAMPKFKLTQQVVYWYKQSPGDTLRQIVKLTVRQQKITNSVFGTQFSDLRWKVTDDKKEINLTMLRTTREDLGIYHCASKVSTGNPEWSAANLTFKENTARVSHYTVIQQPAVSNPVRSGDTAIFQCSVLFDSEKMPCSKDPNIFWFQAKSNNAYPNVIYTDTNRRDECEKRFDTEKSCLFQFSKVVSSSDAGIFYCAVASCGKLLIGNGTRLEIASSTSFEFTALVTAVFCLVFSLILSVVFICCQAPTADQKPSHGMESINLQETVHSSTQKISAEGGNENYAALHFSTRKKQCEGRKKKMETEECFYSEIKI
ncbi:uncharacterized protein LOC103471481 isoform X1 [Poecilia reticulata]|uniref:uncharacterized protein LOC103471481 isoform X1 n=1 Tax=Poecilia reticulata TaxID=8081 RepID=UPI0004A41A1A|nr:PREDICTED: uncharacterized protein LOC103471481 isoform X1 [Poecilia reticulata]